jgi:hypothetical protein
LGKAAGLGRFDDGELAGDRDSGWGGTAVGATHHSVQGVETGAKAALDDSFPAVCHGQRDRVHRVVFGQASGDRGRCLGRGEAAAELVGAN